MYSVSTVCDMVNMFRSNLCYADKSVKMQVVFHIFCNIYIMHQPFVVMVSTNVHNGTITTWLGVGKESWYVYVCFKNKQTQPLGQLCRF